MDGYRKGKGCPLSARIGAGHRCSFEPQHRHRVETYHSALLARLLKTQYAHNINVLRRHRVPLLIGSDLIGRTATIEMAALAGSGLFTNLELLVMWSVTTPQAIFPSRRIGVLQDGYEGSFLVLRGDPLADFAQTRVIGMRVKQGMLLKP